MTERLRAHDLTLRGEMVVLRPMMEEDWPLLLRWNNDPEVLRFAEGDEVTHRTLEEVQRLYRSVSQAAFCFIMESGGLPVGECWLQRMNLDRVVRREGGRDCRRIDLTIGERDHWGRGLGTEAVSLLARFGFESEGAEAIFACDVADYNERSLRLFRALGFRTYDVRRETAGQARQRYDLVRRRVPAPSGSVLEDYWGAVEAFGESRRRPLAMDFVSQIVVGSLSTGDVMPGWSDVDAYLVVHTVSDEVRQKVREMVADVTSRFPFLATDRGSTFSVFVVSRRELIEGGETVSFLSQWDLKRHGIVACGEDLITLLGEPKLDRAWLDRHTDWMRDFLARDRDAPVFWRLRNSIGFILNGARVAILKSGAYGMGKAEVVESFSRLFPERSALVKEALECRSRWLDVRKDEALAGTLFEGATEFLKWVRSLP